MKNALVMAALASCLTTQARAEDTPPVPQGLLACEKIQDAAERVRCYDEQVAAMKRATQGATPGGTRAPAPAAASEPSAAPAGTAAPAATPAEGVPAEASRAGTNAGSGAPAAAPAVPVRPAAAGENSAARFGEEELPPSRQPKRSPGEMTLSSSIAAVAKGPAGIYYFSLANGQVWRADGSSLALDPVIPLVFRAGVPIRIERGSLGSYHMWAQAAGEKNWMYVRRIR